MNSVTIGGDELTQIMKKSVALGHGAETIFGTLDENLSFLENAFEVTLSLAADNLIIEGR